MATITIETRIAAPIELCFDLARDVDAHIRTSAGNRERAVAGKTSGLLDLGDSVTFEAVHFGIRQQLTARIVELHRPARFVDEMVKGAFASLCHETHAHVRDEEAAQPEVVRRAPRRYLIIPFCRRNDTSCVGHS